MNIKTTFIKKNSSLLGFMLMFILAITTNFSYGQNGLAKENFNNGIPATWSVFGNDVGTTSWMSTDDGYLSTKAAMVNPTLDNIGKGNSAQYFLVTPRLKMPENPEIRFWTKQGKTGNQGMVYQLRISAAGQPDINGFTNIFKTFTELQMSSGTGWREQVVTMPALPVGFEVYVAFVAINTQTGDVVSGDSWFVDDVRIISACAPVTQVDMVPSNDSAVINWSHPTATKFAIDVVEAGQGHGEGTELEAFTYTATDLKAKTTYDVYIKTICDSETSSVWAGPFPFTTNTVGLNCNTAIQVPGDLANGAYVLSNNLMNYYDSETYVELDSRLLNCQPVGADNQNHLMGDHAYLTYTPETSGLIDITQTILYTEPKATTQCYNNLSSVFVFDGCLKVGDPNGCLASVITTANKQVGKISNFYVNAGQTYIFVISSPFQRRPFPNNAGICFNFTISRTSCPAPSVSTIDQLKQTSAVASWDNVQNLVSKWQYVVKPIGAGAPSGTDTLITTDTNVNNPLSNLSPGTKYNLYVRSVCDDTPGVWGPPTVFTTQCNSAAIPYYTGFTNADATNPEPCWTVLNLNGDTNQFTFGASALDGPVAKLRTNNGESNDYLVTPQFTLDGVTQKRLRFKYNIYGNWGLKVDNPTGGPGSFEIRYSTTGVGAENFTEILVPLTSYTTAYNYIEMDVILPNIAGDINIAWIVPPGSVQTGSLLYIDDVYVEDLPFCIEPKYPKINTSSITPTSVEVSWVNGYNTDKWEVLALPQGSGTPPSDAKGVFADTNPFTLTNLEPSTQYDIWVRSYCDATHQSIWAGPAKFYTTCIGQLAPYYESFNDDDINSKKFCWTTKNVTDDVAQWTITGTEAIINPASSRNIGAPPFQFYDDYLISVPINAVGQKQLSFKYKVSTDVFFPTPRGNFEVLMSSTPDFSTYTTLIPAHDFTNEEYVEDFVLFEGTGTFYIAFRCSPEMLNPSSSATVKIDDVKITDADLCAYPKELTASAITTNSAKLSWTKGNLETKWEVVIQEPLSGEPTGTGTKVEGGLPEYNATGLDVNTAYEYYVRAVCNDTDKSIWIGPFAFKTGCNPFATPFLETFDSNSQTESCWTITNANADGSQWGLNQPNDPMFGDQMAGMFTGQNGRNDDWLISPTLEVKPNQRLRFYYKTYSEYFADDLKVKFSKNGVAIDQFTTTLYENGTSSTTAGVGVVKDGTTVTLTSDPGVRIGDYIDADGIQTAVYLEGFPGARVTAINGLTITFDIPAYGDYAAGKTISFTHEILNNPTKKEMVINLPAEAVGNTNFAFQIPFYQTRYIYKGQFMFIDNFIIEDIPSCPTIANVTTKDVKDVSFIANWDVVGSETSWEISVQPYGTDAPVGDTLPEYLKVADAHPFTVTGLTPSTRYEYYVRAVCGEGSDSEWIGPFEFTTKCDLTNICKYTFSLAIGKTGHPYESIQVKQNDIVIQDLIFPYNNDEVLDVEVFLCRGVEFKLYYNGRTGISGLQYTDAQLTMKDDAGNVVYTSPLGLGKPFTDLYKGVSSCGTVTCPQPTNVAVSNTGSFSWTPGANETQWEVAFQPYLNATIPQSGKIVDSPNYTPVASDFTDATTATYEFFVRAVCGTNDTSYWTGPKVFVRNDEPSTAVKLIVNPGAECVQAGADATFMGATVSAEPSSCAGVNGGDIWYEFEATAKNHTIALSNFGPGSFYTGSQQPMWPKITMSLYEVQADGSLVEKSCSNDLTLIAMYSSECVIGNTYKIRVTLDETVATNKSFDICVTTPDACDLNAFNYDFELPPMQGITSVLTIIDGNVVPGWRVNTDWGAMFIREGSMEAVAFSGGQYLQLVQDEWDPTDPNIKGLYKDFDTSEIIQMDYSFASATRAANSTLQLFAGPPAGPFVLVTEHAANSQKWQLVRGEYMVPAGQKKTRFIFQMKGDNTHHLLDAANFVPNTDIITTGETLSCSTTTTVQVEARGFGGYWEADANNPSPTNLATPNATSTSITGFSSPGDYVYHWITSYCDKTITYKYLGIDEKPVVENPTIYCLNETAVPLTATVPSGYSLLWYTAATGGVGTAAAPTPITTTVGSDQIFYVSALDASGCEGPRVEIVVQVNELPTATISGATSICPGSTAAITFTGTPQAIVTYTVNAGENETVTLDATGTATVTTAALTADTTYTLVSVAGSDAQACTQILTESVTIIINALPTATIAATTPICAGSTSEVTFVGTPNTTVTYTVDAGENQTIVLDATGNATLTTAVLTANSTYTLVKVAFGDSADCSQALTESVVIVVNELPTVTISEPTTICTGTSSVITFTGTPNATVNYKVDGVDASIVLDDLGKATITTPILTVNSLYELVSVVSGTTTCSQTVTATSLVTVTPLATPDAAFTYAQACKNATTNPLPIVSATFANGGVFSATTITVNPTTGAVDLSTATIGSHEIVYTLLVDQANCIDGAVTKTTIIISDGITPVVGFNYSAVAYCSSEGNQLPITATGFTTGGLFTSTAGLVINAATGEINIAQSTSGTYTITYTVLPNAATCNVGGTHSETITIGNKAVITFEEGCDANSYELTALVENATGATYEWSTEGGSFTQGSTPETIILKMGGNYTVKVNTADGCSTSQSISVTSVACLIQKGISPNNDDKNDYFDLSSLNVKYLSIFNRYGKRVYDKSNYSNQWYGTTNDGKKLPDGTYYYVIERDGQESVTGWIYVIHEN